MNARRDVFLDVLFVLGFVGLAVFLFALAGCAGGARVIEKPVVVPKVTRCTDGATPAWEPVPAPVACKPGMLCYPTAVGVVLVDNIERLRTWAAQVKALCAGGAK